jgi:hypothetical protein
MRWHLKKPSLRNLRARGSEFWHWLTRPARLFGLVGMTFGLPGAIDNFEGWSRWLGKAATHLPSKPPLDFGAFGQWPEHMIAILYQPWVYWGLLFVGAIFVLQAERISSATLPLT